MLCIQKTSSEEASEKWLLLVCFERSCSAVIHYSDVQERAAAVLVQVAQSYRCCVCSPQLARFLSLLVMPRETRLEMGERCFALCAAPPTCFSELSHELFFHEILKGLDLVKALLSASFSASRPGMQVMEKLSRYRFPVLSHP